MIGNFGTFEEGVKTMRLLEGRPTIDILNKFMLAFTYQSHQNSFS